MSSLLEDQLRSKLSNIDSIGDESLINVNEETFWNTLYPLSLDNFNHCWSKFILLAPVEHLRSATAAELLIPIEKITLSYIYLKLLPLCLWICQKRSSVTNERFLIGIIGAPGAGKSVLSDILKISINMLEGNSSCSVLAMDAYHFPNSYLGKGIHLFAEFC
jgi:hypothetical protein